MEIPFILRYERQKGRRGININAIANINLNNDSDMTPCNKGLCLTGLLNVSGWQKGIEITIGLNIHPFGHRGNIEGISISGIYNHIGNYLNGFSYGTLGNYARSNGRIAIQVGAINNLIDYNEEGTVIQLGIYNRIKTYDQTFPIINIKGLKNLFKRKG